MKAEELRKLYKGKNTAISLRISPGLLNLLDEAVKTEEEYKSRNELIEVLIVRYLESKGKL